MSEDNYGKERPRLQRADDISSEKKRIIYIFLVAIVVPLSIKFTRKNISCFTYISILTQRRI